MQLLARLHSLPTQNDSDHVNSNKDFIIFRLEYM